MAVRELKAAMTAWRIGDPAGTHPIFSGEGAARQDARWHRKGQDVIYCSEHYGTAMLEKLVHENGIMPPNQHFLKITLPAGLSYEVVTKDSLSGWDERDGNASRMFGSGWLESGRTCLLLVPSLVSREERNILVNPLHPDAAHIDPGLEMPVRWDERLFG